jgi:hypothetical protein
VTVRGPQFYFNGQLTPSSADVAGTGVRMSSYVTLPSNPNSPVTVTLTSENPAVALLAPYNTTTAGASSITVTIPTSTNYAYFDMIGVAPAEAPQLNGPHGVARDAAGNLYIADYSNHRVRKLDTGGTATGVRIRATAGGIVTGEIPLRVIQSQFYFSGLATTIANGASDTFNVYINVPGYSTQRAAATTAVTLTSNNTSVLADPVDVTIANNATNASASVTAVGAGSTTITASSPGSGIDAVGSGTITVP